LRNQKSQNLAYDVDKCLTVLKPWAAHEVDEMHRQASVTGLQLRGLVVNEDVIQDRYNKSQNLVLDEEVHDGGDMVRLHDPGSVLV
jgi:hypothetical protein